MSRDTSPESRTFIVVCYGSDAFTTQCLSLTIPLDANPVTFPIDSGIFNRFRHLSHGKYFYELSSEQVEMLKQGGSEVRQIETVLDCGHVWKDPTTGAYVSTTRYYHTVHPPWAPGQPLLCYQCLKGQGITMTWKWSTAHEGYDSEVVCLFSTRLSSLA